jgi:hypothetical protein
MVQTQRGHIGSGCACLVDMVVGAEVDGDELVVDIGGGKERLHRMK